MTPIAWAVLAIAVTSYWLGLAVGIWVATRRKPIEELLVPVDVAPRELVKLWRNNLIRQGKDPNKEFDRVYHAEMKPDDETTKAWEWNGMTRCVHHYKLRDCKTCSGVYGDGHFERR